MHLQSTSIPSRRHILGQMRHTAQHALVVVAIAVGAFGKMFEAVIVELPQEGGVSIVSEISLDGLALLQSFGHGNPERATVREPIHPVRNGFVTQHGKHLLRKRHVVNLGGMNIASLWRNLTKVTVSVVHVCLWFLDHLDDTGFHGILVLDALEAGFANLARLFGFLRLAQLGCLRRATDRVGRLRRFHGREILHSRFFRCGVVARRVHGFASTVMNTETVRKLRLVVYSLLLSRDLVRAKLLCQLPN